jgi:hypothetical protein
MFQRNRRGFRRRSNGRSHSSQENGYMQPRSRTNSFSNNQSRNNFRPTQSAEKLLEKYNSLAKEAMSLGDKTLCENYLQHADHYMRVIEDKSKNKEQISATVNNKSTADNKLPPKNIETKNKDVTKSQE